MITNNNKTYDLIFEGKIKKGFEQAIIKENLKQFFKNTSFTDRLLAGKRTILKKKISRTEAEKYKSVLEQCGIITVISEHKQADYDKNQLNSENQYQIQPETQATAFEPAQEAAINPQIIKKIEDLETVTRALVRVISFNQKIIWGLLILTVLSIVLWAVLYLHNPTRIITFIDEHKALSNEFSLNFKTEDGEFSLPVKSYYPIRKIHLTQIKDALEEYHKINEQYPVSSGSGKWFDGLYRGKGKSGGNWIDGLVPEYLLNLPKDPFRSNNVNRQYLYRSDGKDYKLIAVGTRDVDLVSKIDKTFIDPKRMNNAYGYWTRKARNW